MGRERWGLNARWAAELRSTSATCFAACGRGRWRGGLGGEEGDEEGGKEGEKEGGGGEDQAVVR